MNNKMNTDYQWKRFFPFSITRDTQEKAINFILSSFLKSNKRYVIAELGTGTGKSAIGLTVGRYLNSIRIPNDDYVPGTYVLTTQKVLQEQYVHDFGPPNGELQSIKSASNYKCEFYTGNTCGESQRLVKNETQGSAFWRKCTTDCCYKRQKKLFIDSEEGTTNYSYFMAETKYGGKLKPRELLVLDECHNLESELSKFVETSVSEKFAKDTLKLKWPSTSNQMKMIEWLRTTYIPAAVAHLEQAQLMILKLNMKDKLKDFEMISSKIELLDKHICKMHRFMEMWSDDNWVMSIVESEEKGLKKLEFKPVDVSPYTNDLLLSYGRRVLMMSATIVDRDVFCATLGLKQDEVDFLSIDSPFPIENRPIYYAPVGAMAQSTIDQTLPKLAEMVKLIMEQHKGDKGIIHCQSYKIASYIKRNVKSSRLLMHDSFNREEMIAKHAASSKPTILLSPSLSEGIDLKDELSRFQILCKIPFPYLGDPLTKKRMTKNRLWYPYQTAKTIIQSVGRSIRNETDHAITYILDSNWEKFYQQHENMFPESFKKALKKA